MPDTTRNPYAGPLTAADLDCSVCTGRCNQDRACTTPAEACTELGAELGTDAPRWATPRAGLLLLAISAVGVIRGIAALWPH